MTQDLKKTGTQDRHQRDALHALIRDQVMHILGEPGNLLHVQVQRLWGVNYRVNVFVGVSIDCARIGDSFFLKTDGDGNILTATPQLTRRY